MIINLICKLKNKTRDDLSLSYSFYYFLTRSNIKSLWFTLIK